MPRDLIRPWGAHFSTAKQKSRPRQSGLPSEKGGLSGANGLAFGRRPRAGRQAWRAGFRRQGFLRGVRRAKGGGRQKNGRWRALQGSQGCARVPGARAKCWASRAIFRGRAGRKPSLTGAKRGVWAASRGGYGGRWGQKSPFLPRKGRATGLCWGENWRRKLTGRVGLFGPVQGIFGSFRRKKAGLAKALSRAYRKKPRFAPFLCRWRTVIGASNLVDRSGCYSGRKE